MAGFKDIIPEFNPYVAQQPVEAMVQVGMMKQKQYDANLQKIQQSMSNIAGLAIARDVDKQYLNNKMNDMSSQLSVFAGSDLSSNRLTGQLKGMVDNMANDEIVRNAVASTQRYQQQMAFIDKERQDGNLTPDNYYHFQKQANAWFQDPNEGASFNGQYVKHFDVLEYTREVFDDIKPDGMTYDDVFSGVDENGVPTLTAAMKRMKKEGIMPEKAKAVVDQVFNDPRVRTQLQISGEYNYRGFTPQMLQQNILDQKDASVKLIDKQLEQLKIKKAAGANVQKDIDALTTQRETVISRANNFAQQALDNPDSVRGNLYTEQTRLNYTRMFTNVNTSETLHDNPVWKGNWEIQKEANRNARHNEEMRLKKNALAWDQRMDLANLDIDRMKIEADKAKSGSDGFAGLAGDKGVQSQEKGKFDVVAYQRNIYNKAQQQYSSATNRVLYEGLLRQDNYSNVQDLLNANPEMTEDQAIAKVIEQEAIKQGYITTQQTPNGEIEVADIQRFTTEKISEVESTLSSNPNLSELETLYDDYDQKKKYFQSEKAEMDAQTKLFEDELKAVGVDVQEGELFTHNNKDYYFTPDDLIDFAMWRENRGLLVQSWFSDDAEEKMKLADKAKERLLQKYPKDVVDRVGNMMKEKTANRTPNYGILDAEEGLQTKLWTLEKQMRDADFTDAITNRKQRIINRYGKDPNKTFTIFSEDNKFNEAQRRRLQQISAAYYGTEDDPLNDSDSFEEFTSLLADQDNADKLDLVLDMATGIDGEKVAYVRNIKGDKGMYLKWEDALMLKPDLKDQFAPEKVNQIQTFMRSNNGSTSQGDPQEVSTYKNGGGYFNNFNFPGMRGSKSVFVQGNLVQDRGTGKIIPYLYYNQVTPGGEYQGVIKLQSVDNIGTALNLFNDPSVINPISVSQMMFERGLGPQEEE